MDTIKVTFRDIDDQVFTRRTSALINRVYPEKSVEIDFSDEIEEPFILVAESTDDREIEIIEDCIRRAILDWERITNV